MLQRHCALVATVAILVLSQGANAAVSFTVSPSTATADVAPASLVFTITEDSGAPLFTNFLLHYDRILIDPTVDGEIFMPDILSNICSSVVDYSGNPILGPDSSGIQVVGECVTDSSGTLIITIGADPPVDGSGNRVVVATVTSGLAAAKPTYGDQTAVATWQPGGAAIQSNASLVYTSQTRVAASAAVLLTAGAPISGTEVEGVTVTFTPTYVMNTSSERFTMTSPLYAIRAAAGPSPTTISGCAVTQGGTSRSAVCSLTMNREFVVVFDDADNIPILANDLVTITLNRAGAIAVFEQHVTAGSVVTFDIMTTSDPAVRSDILGWTTAATAAGSDPVAIVGGVKRQFTLPPGDLVPLLVAPDMSLHGSVFEGMGPWEQWFGRMVIFSGQKDRWLDISIKKDILMFNASLNARNAFETLDVVVGKGDVNNPQPGSSLLVPDRSFDLPPGFLAQEVTFWPVHRGHKGIEVSIGRARRECTDVMGETFHLFICSSAAREYFGWQRHLAIRFAHLDVVVVEITNASCIDGLLPQLWGMNPLSEENAKYLDEAPTTATPASSNALPKMAGWAGGATPEDLQAMMPAPSDGAITI